MKQHSWDYDVAVIGGGPAGSSAAAMLARQGRRVVVLERESFPRFHIGESLLPMSGPMLRTLGVDRRIASRGFVDKHGATFATESDSRRVRIDFSASDEVPEPITHHVPRAEFDQLLLEHAAESGAEVRERARVRDVRLEPSGADVAFDTEDGSHAVRVGYVLDASGRYGFLARRMGLRVSDPDLRKVALFGHFEGDPQDDAPPGDIRVVTVAGGGWWWIIPLGGRTSVGYVFDKDVDPRRADESAEETFARRIDEAPFMRDSLRGLSRVGSVRCEGDYSYSTRQYGGERFLLLGDAGSFIDPVFSTGVELAIVSGIEAAEAVEAPLARGGRPLTGAPLRRFTRRQRHRYRFFRRFVASFYTETFRDMLYQADDWPATTRAIVTALAGNDRPRLSTRIRLSCVFFGLSLRERRRRRPRSKARAYGRSDRTAPAQTGTQ